MRQKLNERTRRVTFHPFPFNLTIIVTDDIAKSVTKRERMGLTYPGDNTAACVFNFPDEGRTVMVLPENPRLSWVVHESSHVVVHMMQYAGISMDKEVLAYYTGELSETIWHFAQKAKPPLRRPRRKSRQVCDKLSETA